VEWHGGVGLWRVRWVNVLVKKRLCKVKTGAQMVCQVLETVALSCVAAVGSHVCVAGRANSRVGGDGGGVRAYDTAWWGCRRGVECMSTVGVWKNGRGKQTCGVRGAARRQWPKRRGQEDGL